MKRIPSHERIPHPAAPAGRPVGSLWKKIGGGSLSVSIVVHLILLSLAALWIFSVIPEKRQDVDFMPKGGGGGTPGAKAEDNQKKRATMSVMNSPRLAAKGMTSTFTLPEPDPASETASIGSLSRGGLSGGLGGGGSDGGRGDGHGRGFGSGMGPGMGGLGAHITFFNQKVVAQRVAYVIDYSASMHGKREKLMKNELSASVAGLSSTSQFQLIFFSGPAWVAGDQFEGDNKSGNVEIKNPRGEIFKWDTAGAKGWHGEWKQVGKHERPEWLVAGMTEKEIAAHLIRDTRLTFGTCWTPSLEMALNMEPMPNVIFFMTDVVAENTEMRTIIAKARAKHVVINTIAMMEPDAGEDMKKLAHETGGKFTIVREDQSIENEP